MRTIALVASAALVVGSCAQGSEDRPGVDGPAADTSQLSPTETDEPFDLDGGVTSSAEGVTVEPDDPREALRPDAAGISTAWATDWTRSTVPLGEFAAGLTGADPRDRIPPIDVPRFERVDVAGSWLDPDEPGALVRVAGEARFYPLSILTRHEIVNDRFGDVPVAVTYCPLCNTALAFDRRVDGQALRFGVSGLLRISDLVMWDDRTESLWQQITGEAVVGELAGTRLAPLPTAIVSFEDFADAHPEGWSLSRDTGFPIVYGTNPYVGYSSRPAPIAGFVTGETDPRLPALERVVSVTVGDEPVAYPFSVLAGERVVNDTVAGTPVVVWFGGATRDALDAGDIAASATVGTGIAFDRVVDGRELSFSANDDGTFTDTATGSTWTLLGAAVDGPLAGAQLELVPHRNEFWFAFAGFFPDADVYGR